MSLARQFAARAPAIQANPNPEKRSVRAGEKPKQEEELSVRHNKAPITIRLKPETIAKFKATGKGWQSRISDILDRASAHP